MKRTEKDVVWSTMTQGHYCKACGQPAIETPDGFLCVNDPDCLNAMQEDAEKDCAPEGGNSYAVFAPDA